MSYCLTYLTPAFAPIRSSLCPVPVNELDQGILIGKANLPLIFHILPVFIRQWYDSGNSHLLGHNLSCLMECTLQYTNCYYFSHVKNRSYSFSFILLLLEIKFWKKILYSDWLYFLCYLLNAFGISSLLFHKQLLHRSSVQFIRNLIVSFQISSVNCQQCLT